MAKIENSISQMKQVEASRDFLRLIEEYIISPDPPPPAPHPQPRTHRAAAYRALAHGPQPREPCTMGLQPRELQPR